jgi:nitroimidazol reductase NimA-like FMN-containing flavoprotein (pyridoxamine 5'-phosphate oxidase superfamily)
MSRSSTTPPTDRVRVRRMPERGHYDADTINPILDEAIVCHVGLVVDGQPYVIPSQHVRDGDRLLVHGSSASRPMRVLAAGAPCCVTVTLLDGLVCARSAYNHSANYRSVVVIGTPTPIDEPDEKLAALALFTNRIIPNRWDELRPPTATELKATTIVALPLDEASAKVRTGPPGDNEEDYDAVDCWAGVIPIATTFGPPIADPRLRPGIALTDNIAGYGRGA